MDKIGFALLSTMMNLFGLLLNKGIGMFLIYEDHNFQVSKY